MKNTMKLNHLLMSNSMVNEEYCNMVYFSGLMPERCYKTFKGLEDILARYGVKSELIEGTKDI